MSQAANDYSDAILDYFEDRSRRGRCENPTHRCGSRNALCGDVVLIELRTTPAGVIESIRFTAEGCCLSQAGAAAIAERFEGKLAGELANFDATEMLKLAGLEITPARRDCWTLALRAAYGAIRSPLAPAKPAQPVQPAEAVA